MTLQYEYTEQLNVSHEIGFQRWKKFEKYNCLRVLYKFNLSL